jgi:protein N-terminal methyltransferase
MKNIISINSFETTPSLSFSSTTMAPPKVGSDSYGETYSSIEEMWASEGVVAGEDNADWYERAAAYYEDHCDATVDGVLGGFAHITELDLDFSRNFVTAVQTERPGLEWDDGAACECGAGIGRVSKGLLLELGVPRCDLVESSEKLLAEAPDFIGDPNSSLCRFICQGLQEWAPVPNTYSIIWIQWVLCYLTDEDIVAFLKRCGTALTAHGVIVMKENTCEGETFVLDKDDASVTRSLPYWLQLIEDAGLRVVRQEMQTNFPDELFPVPMLALEVDPDKKDQQ